MNTDTLAGSATDLHGKVKEGIGNALGDPAMREEGRADQLSGHAQKTFGEAKDAVRRFVNERPFAAAALGGVVGLALLNTLRGK